jgi:hypothetical protein
MGKKRKQSESSVPSLDELRKQLALAEAKSTETWVTKDGETFLRLADRAREFREKFYAVYHLLQEMRKEEVSPRSRKRIAALLDHVILSAANVPKRIADYDFKLLEEIELELGVQLCAIHEVYEKLRSAQELSYASGPKTSS